MQYLLLLDADLHLGASGSVPGDFMSLVRGGTQVHLRISPTSRLSTIAPHPYITAP
jgi:hypothetical protein